MSSDNQPIDLNDLDTMDLSNVETGIPLIAQGLHEVEVLEITPKPNKNNTGTNLSIKLGLVNHTKKFDGSGEVNPGYPLFDLISLTPTEKYDPRQRLAAFMECFLGVKNVPFNPISQFIGLKGMVRVKVEKDDQYGDKNRIAGYVKKS